MVEGTRYIDESFFDETETSEDDERGIFPFPLTRALEVRGITLEDLKISEDKPLEDILTAFGEIGLISVEDPALFEWMRAYFKDELGISDEAISMGEMLQLEAFFRVQGREEEDIEDFFEILEDYDWRFLSDESYTWRMKVVEAGSSYLQTRFRGK